MGEKTPKRKIFRMKKKKSILFYFEIEVIHHPKEFSKSEIRNFLKHRILLNNPEIIN